LTIKGQHYCLWRAVDQEGHTLDVSVQRRRDRQAVKRFFFRKLLKRLQYVPRVLVTDKLKSYGAAKAQIMPCVEHRQHKGLNNRPEVSHQPGPATGTADAAIQIAKLGPTFFIGTRRHQ